MVDRKRSFWAWGYEDKLADDATRRGLIAFAGAMLPAAKLELLPLPALDRVSLGTPRVEVPETLRGFVSSGKDERVGHTYGKSYRDIRRGFSGDFACAPDVVARPIDDDQIHAIFDWAAHTNLAVIPFGGGTSVVSGTEADVPAGYNGVVCLDVTGLNRVLEVDPVSQAARIQAGASGPVLEAQLATHGFTLRCFPQSFELSTLGGWIATRAGGHFATLYTHIDDLVESVRMLTPTGVWQSRRLPGSGAGPSPDRMVLGSEGILGVITEAWMRVQRHPRWRSSASVTFSDFGAAVHATRDIAQSGLFPSNCRLLDAREAMLHRVATDNTNVLLLGFESADHAVGPWMTRALEIATKHGGECRAGRVDKDEGQRSGHSAEAGAWRQAFIDAPYLLNTLVSVGAVVDTFETACTWDAFDDLHRAVIHDVRAAMQRECGGGLISCRFTHVYPDGPAPYYTFMAGGRRGGELEQHAVIKAAASDALIRHGATITHHHAVGRSHRPWYERQRPEPFAAALRAAKAAVDPAGILNPGVLLAVPDRVGS